MARKLPRRVMSMAKRADTLASDIGELIGGMVGEEESGGSPPAPTEGEKEEARPPAWAYIGAWIAAVSFLLVIMLGGRLIFTIGTDVDVPLGVQTREVSEPEYQAARDALREPTPTTSPPATVPLPRSGGGTSDVSSIPPHYHLSEQGAATVGGTVVPPLECEEDEVIGFFGVPNTLACIHIDSFR